MQDAFLFCFSGSGLGKYWREAVSRQLLPRNSRAGEEDKGKGKGAADGPVAPSRK